MTAIRSQGSSTGPGLHIHPRDLSTCGDCNASMFDTNKSIIREITNFTSIPYDGYEEVIGAIIAEDLQSAIQRAVLHGIEIGRNAQKEQDRQHLEQYRDALVRMRQERDEAREANMRYRDAVMDKEKELRETEDRLVAIQMAYDDLQETMTGHGSGRNENPALERAAASSDSEDTDSDFWVPDTDDELDDYEVAQMLALMEEDFLLQREIWDARVQPAALEQVERATIPQTSPEFYQGSSTIVVSPRNPQRPQIITDVVEMQRLMRLAQEPNQREVVKTMKETLLSAERTPGAQRTEAQKYMLRKWRKPRHSRRPGVLPLSLTERTADEDAEIQACNHEIIVDASSFGIGFIQKDVGWVGWRFASDAVIPLGPDGNIIMSWAEMIAVEAGLRAFIAQGHRACSILLRSDNMGVIKAIKDRVWMEKYGLDEILQRVLGLCQENEIKLVPLWIWTEANPADAISRGRYPSVNTKLWVPLSLSPELGAILHPV